MKILVLDDCATIRAILKVFLMNPETELLEAKDGSTALRILRDQPVDLVVADVQMEGMDGIEFVAAVRSDPSATLQAIPVILLTSDLDEELKMRGLAAGANAFVHKPISPAALKQAIGVAVGRAG